jgi:hypothetical protein
LKCTMHLLWSWLWIHSWRIWPQRKPGWCRPMVLNVGCTAEHKIWMQIFWPPKLLNVSDSFRPLTKMNQTYLVVNRCFVICNFSFYTFYAIFDFNQNKKSLAAHLLRNTGVDKCFPTFFDSRHFFFIIETVRLHP